MPKEIERKFLVVGAFKSSAAAKIDIVQAYISNNPKRIVRIRIVNKKAYITIKGKSNESGTSRFEWEKEISRSDAEKLIALRESNLINKTRYIIPVKNGLVFEVDEFHGRNKGLIIAEIELESEDQEFNKPEWIGAEVTGEIKYYNSYLSKKAYQDW